MNSSDVAVNGDARRTFVRARRTRISAPAKVNLTLDVGPRRASDGFHDLDSLVMLLWPSDTLVVAVEPSPTLTITCQCSDPTLPTDDTNLAVRAARLFCETFALTGEIHIELMKRLPAQAGLGGGSSDAAAVLRALRCLAPFHVTDDGLQGVGAQIGSDVPLFLCGTNLVRMQGRGEMVTPLPQTRRLHGVLVRPDVGVPTGPAYRLLDEIPDRAPGDSTTLLFGLLRHSRAREWEVAALLHNDFEAAVFPAFPEVAAAHRALLEAGALGAVLCGSGSCVFGVAKNCEHAREIAGRIRQTKRFPFVHRAETHRSPDRATRVLLQSNYDVRYDSTYEDYQDAQDKLDRKTRIRCCVCNWQIPATLWRRAGDNLLGGDEKYTALRCGNCGTVRLDPRPKGDYSRFYTPTTYARAESERETEIGKRLEAYALRVADHADELIPPRPNNEPPRRVLDVGCGDGRFLRILQARGWDVEGIETDSVAADLASRRLNGADIFTLPLEKLSLPRASFDLITGLHVLEHVTQPRKMLRACEALLRSDGALLLHLPNAGSLEAKLFRASWYHLDLPRHLWGFTQKSLRQLLAQANFDDVRFRYLPFLFAPQSLRNALRRGAAKRSVPQTSEPEAAKDGNGRGQTRLFLAMLAASSALGRTVPGEIMIVSARVSKSRGRPSR